MALRPPRIPKPVLQAVREQARSAPGKDEAVDVALRLAWGKFEGDVRDRVASLRVAARTYLRATADPNRRPEDVAAKRRGFERALELVEDEDA